MFLRAPRRDSGSGGALIGTAAQSRLSGRLVTMAFAVSLAAIGIWLIAG